VLVSCRQKESHQRELVACGRVCVVPIPSQKFLDREHEKEQVGEDDFSNKSKNENSSRTFT